MARARGAVDAGEHCLQLVQSQRIVQRRRVEAVASCRNRQAIEYLAASMAKKKKKRKKVRKGEQGNKPQLKKKEEQKMSRRKKATKGALTEHVR